MRKIDYLILVGNFLFTFLWIRFQPFRLKNWTESVYVMLAVPIVIIFWELLKRLALKRR